MFKMEMYYSLHDKNSSNVVVTMMMMTMMTMTYFIYAQLKYQINNRVKKILYRLKLYIFAVWGY